MIKESYFPFETFYKWVSGDNSSEFNKREFSFTIDDIYLRYKSYKTAEEFKKSVTSKVPNKIDIGPVYTVSVRNFCLIFFFKFSIAIRTTYNSSFKI